MKRQIFKVPVWLIAIVGVALAAGGIYWDVSSSQAPSLGSVVVGRGNVVESGDEPANVIAENSVALSFEEPGQIANVNVKEGDQLATGQAIASLDASNFSASLEQANAALAAAQAKLNALTSGTRPEQLAIDQSAVSTAGAALGATLGSAYTAADDAVRNQTDNLFSNPQSNNPVFLVPVNDSQLLISIQNSRITIGAALTTWFSATASSSDPGTLAAMVNPILKNVKSYLDTIALGVNAALPNSVMTTSVLAGYKANVVTARNEVVAAVSSVTNAESALQGAKNQLALAQAGATQQDIAAQQAAVMQAQAAATYARIAVDHASIRAPFAGVVQGLTAKIGQVVAIGAPVVSIVNNNGLKVEGYVSEADIAKGKEGDAANVTLDAYGTATVFPAIVTTIDAAQTQVNNTPVYKVTVHFTKPDVRLKDGMSGNLRIVVAEHDNVLEVPSRLVIKDGSSYFLLVKNGAITQRQSVQIGAVGDNGTTEIISGVNEGDTITNF